jgi:GMC oxidoreductase
LTATGRPQVLGLRVADASVMPTIPSANTNATAVMIGEFASRLLVAGGAGASTQDRPLVVTNEECVMNATDLDRAAAVSSPSSRRTTNEECVMSDFRLLINGRLVEGAGALDVINPATGL